MKNYYRLMLGRKSAFAEQCFAGDFVGADFGIAEDLSHNIAFYRYQVNFKLQKV